MVVAVEDPWHQPETGEVDRFEAGRVQVLADLRDAVVLDPDVERAGEAPARVEDVGLSQDVLLGDGHGDTSTDSVVEGV